MNRLVHLATPAWIAGLLVIALGISRRGHPGPGA
jgi:hypothetical protein